MVPPWCSGYAVALYAKGCEFKSAHGCCCAVQKPSISPWLFGQCTLNIYPVYIYWYYEVHIIILIYWFYHVHIMILICWYYQVHIIILIYWYYQVDIIAYMS